MSVTDLDSGKARNDLSEVPNDCLVSFWVMALQKANNTGQILSMSAEVRIGSDHAWLAGCMRRYLEYPNASERLLEPAERKKDAGQNGACEFGVCDLEFGTPAADPFKCGLQRDYWVAIFFEFFLNIKDSGMVVREHSPFEGK